MKTALKLCTDLGASLRCPRRLDSEAGVSRMLAIGSVSTIASGLTVTQRIAQSCLLPASEPVPVAACLRVRWLVDGLIACYLDASVQHMTRASSTDRNIGSCRADFRAIDGEVPCSDDPCYAQPQPNDLTPSMRTPNLARHGPMLCFWRRPRGSECVEPSRFWSFSASSGQGI